MFKMKFKRMYAAAASVIAGVMILLTGCATTNQIVIGTQTFTEVKVLAEMYKALIEDRTGLEVKIIPDLASSTVVLNALKRGEIQIATLYSGEIFNNHFPIENTKDRAKVLEQAQTGFDQYYDFKWMDSLGFENTYAFTVSKAIAAEKGYKKISDVAKDAEQLRLGVDTTWLERSNDGYPDFQKVYNFKFGKEYPMTQSLVYEAAGNNQVDVVLAYSTDSRLKAYELQTLEDDKQFFPPYDASTVMLNKTAEQYPEVQQVLQELVGKFDEETIINLSYKVDIEKKSEREVALQYLQEQGLLTVK
jgi:osmoprotectant transport system substrate-binding protein